MSPEPMLDADVEAEPVPPLPPLTPAVLLTRTGVSYFKSEKPC